MALIRIVDSWLRSPAGSPVHQRVVMVVADSWSEQRVLMRAYAESPDQTRPTIVLHGTQLAISPASTDPHGSWGIHVEPPIDGRAQELREQLMVAARRLAGSKGNPPRLADEAPRFERKRTNNWAPGTPRDLPEGRGMRPGEVDASYYEPSARMAAPPGAAPAASVPAFHPGAPGPAAPAAPAVQTNPAAVVPRAAPNAATISPFTAPGSAPRGPNRPAPGPFPHVPAAPRPPVTGPGNMPVPTPVLHDEKTLPGPVPAPLAVRKFLESATRRAAKSASEPPAPSASELPDPAAAASDTGNLTADPLTQPTYNGPTPRLANVPGLGSATGGGGIPNPAYSGQRAAASARQTGSSTGNAAGWSSPLSPSSARAGASARGRARRTTGKSVGSVTITGFASGVSAPDARAIATGKAAREAASFANLVGKTMPPGFHLTPTERAVLDALASQDSLSAGQVAQLTGVADGATWMSLLMDKLRSFGLDLVIEQPIERRSASPADRHPTYTIRR